MKIKALVVFIVLIVVLMHFEKGQVSSPVAKLSMSSDGRYVLSSHFGHHLILWDTEKETRKILNRKANIYSPYFIPNSDHFLWQDAKTNNVFEQSVAGDIIQVFNPGFAVYGQVASTHFQYYVAAAKKWGLYAYNNGELINFKVGLDGLGGAKLLNLSLVNNLLVSAGETGSDGEEYPIVLGNTLKDLNPKVADSFNYSLFDGIVLWNLQTQKPIRKFFGPHIQTVASLSPDSNHIVAGDNSLTLMVWDKKTGKGVDMDMPTYPNCGIDKKCLHQVETTKVIPADFYSHYDANGPQTAALKFIDTQNHFLRFIESVNYATLYNVTSPKVINYLPLGKNPSPDIYSIFTSSNLIDTAPEAKLLVIGQADGSGIIVYRFDEKKQTLTRLWAPKGPPAHRRITNPDNPWEY